MNLMWIVPIKLLSLINLFMYFAYLLFKIHPFCLMKSLLPWKINTFKFLAAMETVIFLIVYLQIIVLFIPTVTHSLWLLRIINIFLNLLRFSIQRTLNFLPMDMNQDYTFLDIHLLWWTRARAINSIIVNIFLSLLNPMFLMRRSISPL